MRLLESVMALLQWICNWITALRLWPHQSTETTISHDIYISICLSTTIYINIHIYSYVHKHIRLHREKPSNNTVLFFPFSLYTHDVPIYALPEKQLHTSQCSN